MMPKELLIGILMNETINFRNIPDERVGRYGAKSASQLRFQIRATAKTRATDELRAEVLWPCTSIFYQSTITYLLS
jgi:hypothetical protein